MVALATPANATENDTFLVTIASNGQVTTTPTQQKPTPAKAITLQSPVLDQCVSHTKCFQAGTYYYGFGTLGAFDDKGVYHEAELWTNPIYLGCTI
jgi:hypothetical protein